MSNPIELIGTISESVEEIIGDFDTSIIVNDIDVYEGEYNIIPTTHIIELLTQNKKLEENIIIQKVPDGALRDISLIVRPIIRILQSGLIIVNNEQVSQISPVEIEGWIDNDSCEIEITGNNTMQLPVAQGESISPHEYEQTIVEAGKYVIGDIKVLAIPSDYVGTAIPRKTVFDITFEDREALGIITGEAVVPAGYYISEARKAIPNASLRDDATITVNPTITINLATGEITANNDGEGNPSIIRVNGYIATNIRPNISVDGESVFQLPTKSAETYTPNKNNQQIIQAGQFLIGDQTIGKIPDEYYDMTGDMSWLGADAELINTFTLPDVLLSDTDFNTWTPSTTAKDILATRTAGSFTTQNFQDENDYYIITETIIKIITPSTATKKALPLYLVSYIIQSINKRPSSFTNIEAGNINGNEVATILTRNFLRYYGSTENTITYTWNASYGFYCTATAATFSSTTANNPTVTVKTPKVTARCSTTYMSTDNAALVDKQSTVIKQKCYIYKTKKENISEGATRKLSELVVEVANGQ